ncbi:uncharacterized protein [Nicotiana tomentosiformis]|uniref:uncharacterized protein n=1 Tax=Nicotiana tomentosiformis TaxID=4098 RepID=UPI00388C8252
MAKISKLVPQKENASSSRPAGDKTPAEPRPEECVSGGVEDATGLSDLEVSRKDSGEASSLFSEAQQALNRASALHREAFSWSPAELRRCEVDLRGLTEEMNALKLLCGQKEKETKDLRAELAKAHQDQIDLIEQAESQLQGMREKISIQAKKIEELKARLASKLAKAKSEAEKAKAEAEVIVAVYRDNAEAAQVQAREAAETAQTRAYWIGKLAKCPSRRETLKEIHARGFDLTNEIVKARDHEAEAGALATSDNDDDDDGSKSGSENGEDRDGEDAAPREDQEP